MGADIEKDIIVLEMGVEKGAGGVFETAMPTFKVDKVFDREVVE